QVGRQRGDERLAFAGGHLGDLAFVEDGAADELDVEVAHLGGAPGGLAAGGEGVGEDGVEGLAFPDPGAELVGQLGERAVREAHHLRFERIDLLANDLPVAADGALVLGAEDAAQELADPFDQYFHVHSEIPAWRVKTERETEPERASALWNVAEDRRAP